MSPRTPRGAITEAARIAGNDIPTEVGMCLKIVRGFFNVAAREPDAVSAWNNAERKHRTTNPADIPRGVPVFWTGSEHGHVALSAGNGRCYSSDIKRSGFVDNVPLSLIAEKWGFTLAGWTEDLNGVDLPDAREPEPKPEPKPHVDHDPRDEGHAVDAKKALRKSVDNTRNEATKGKLRKALAIVRRVTRKAN